MANILGPDMAGFPISPGVSKQPAAGGFPTGVGFEYARPSAAGFPNADFDPLWEYVVAQCHFSRALGVLPAVFGSGSTGWDTSQYKRATGTSTTSLRVNNTRTLFGEYTSADGITGGCACRFGPSADLIIGTQDFTVEAQCFFSVITSGAGAYNVFMNRPSGVNTPNNWRITVINNAGSLDLLFQINDVTALSGINVVKLGAGLPFGFAPIAYSRVNLMGYLYYNYQLVASGPDLTDYNVNAGISPVGDSSLLNGFPGFMTEFRCTLGPIGSGAGRYQFGAYPQQYFPFPDQSGP